MIKYLILIILVLTISVIYVFVYYRRFNISLKHKEIKLYKVSPNKFITYVMVISLLFGFGVSICEVNTLDKYITAVEEYTVENKYLTDDNLDIKIQYVFEEYNMYFGGVYYDNENFVLCIRNDAPTDLIQYLESLNVEYSYVDYNYSDLLALYQVTIRSSKDLENIIGVGINEKNNKVVVYTSDLEEANNVYQRYIIEGILELKESEELIER